MILYEFRERDSFKEACLRAHKTGREMEVFTPFPDEELTELLAVKTSLIGQAAFVGGILGFIIAALLTYVPSVLTYPLNVGGRPLNSWPAFMVIAFELTILFSALTTVAAFLLVNKWPRLDRNVLQLEEFKLRKDENYFLLLQEELPDVKADHAYRLDEHTP